MRIKISQRLRPFSHFPGTFCLLPKTTLRFQFFPTRWVIEDLSEQTAKEKKILDLKLNGPVVNFTVQQDLEKKILYVWGHYQEGYVRCAFFQEQGSVVLRILKAPDSGIRMKDSDLILYQNDSFPLPVFFGFSLCQKTERVSFGCHKAQDWDRIKRRAEIQEILPFWHRLGICTPKTFFKKASGTLKLLKICEEKLQNGIDISKMLLAVFQAGFEGILSPRLTDTQYQGFGVSEMDVDPSESSLTLLTEGAKLISRLLLQVHSDSIDVLPHLPAAFHCGRMTDFTCGELGYIDIEWSKKTIRRLIFRCCKNQTIRFHFKKRVKWCRIRQSVKEKGKWMQVDDSVDCQEGRVYFLDRFQR